jgi:hypothetical protein
VCGGNIDDVLGAPSGIKRFSYSFSLSVLLFLLLLLLLFSHQKFKVLFLFSSNLGKRFPSNHRSFCMHYKRRERREMIPLFFSFLCSSLTTESRMDSIIALITHTQSVRRILKARSDHSVIFFILFVRQTKLCRRFHMSENTSSYVTSLAIFQRFCPSFIVPRPSSMCMYSLADLLSPLTCVGR